MQPCLGFCFLTLQHAGLDRVCAHVVRLFVAMGCELRRVFEAFWCRYIFSVSRWLVSAPVVGCCGGRCGAVRPPPIQPWQATPQNDATLPWCACVPHCWRVEQHDQLLPLVLALPCCSLACVPPAWLPPATWPVEAAWPSPLMRDVGCRVCALRPPLPHRSTSQLRHARRSPTRSPLLCSGSLDVWSPVVGTAVRPLHRFCYSSRVWLASSVLCRAFLPRRHSLSALAVQGRLPPFTPLNSQLFVFDGASCISLCSRLPRCAATNGSLAAGAAPPVVSRAWSTSRRPVSSS